MEDYRGTELAAHTPLITTHPSAMELSLFVLCAIMQAWARASGSQYPGRPALRGAARRL